MLMLGTSEMIQAAASDGYSGAYGVVTIDKLKCGQCVEIVNTDKTSFLLAPNINAQIFNTVADSVDVYMPSGGLGAFNGCSDVGSFSSLNPFYAKYPTSGNTDFLDYLISIGYSNPASFIDDDIQNSGGLRGGLTYANCVANGGTMQSCTPGNNGCAGGGGFCIQNDTACDIAFPGVGDYTTTKAREACKYVFNRDLHWNRPVHVTVIECPTSLTDLTGQNPFQLTQLKERHLRLVRLQWKTVLCPVAHDGGTIKIPPCNLTSIIVPYTLRTSWGALNERRGASARSM